MVNSNQKGKRGEREWVNWLKIRGIDARRGQQYKGSSDSPDVVSDLKQFHFEVKRTEKFNLYTALKQATNDAEEKTPIIAHKKNREKWVIIMDAEDWIKLLPDIKL